MVLEKIEVQATFQDGITSSLQKAIDKMEELQVLTSETAKAFNRLNRAQKKNTTSSTEATAATIKLVEANEKLLKSSTDQRGALHKIVIQTKRTGEAMVKTGESINDTFSNEVRSRIQNALDTMVEFGATIDDVESASKKLSKAQLTGTRGMAQQANVLRTLVDESENAEFAMRNMGRATTIAAQAGIKLEDAGRQLGMAFRGDATILRNFDAIARRAAEAIEKINNPAERQKQIMKELAAAQKRVGGSLNKLQDSLAVADSKLAKVGLSVKRLATGLAGLGLAAITAGFALLTKSVQKYRDGNEDAQASTASLTMSLNRASDETGKAINNFFELDETVGQLADTIDKGTDSNGLYVKELLGFTLIGKVAQSVFKSLDEAIIGVTKRTDLGTIAQLSYVDIMQITIGVLNNATAATRRYEIAQDNARKAASRRRRDEAAALDKEDAESQKRMEAELSAARKAGPSAHLSPDMSPTVRAALIQESREAHMAEFGPDFAGPSAPPPTKKKRRRGGGGGRRRRSKGGPTAMFEQIAAMTEEYNESIAAAETAAKVSSNLANVSSAVAAVSIEVGDGHTYATSKLDEFTKKAEAAAIVAKKIKDGYKDAGRAVTEFANGAVTLAANSVSMLFENIASGQGILNNFGTFLLKSMGDLLGQMGQSFIMLGAGFDSIKTGIMSPGALIAIGVGMVALSGSLKGFAKRSEGSQGGGASGGGTAAALERFGRQIFSREGTDQGREVTINIEGRSMRGYVLDVAADGARRGSVPLTPRRV